MSTERTPAAAAPPRRLLNPSAAAKKLGISRPRVYGLAAEGKLEAVKSSRGFTRFDADAVALFSLTYRPRLRRPRGSQLARRISGPLAAAVFASFAAGMSLVQIVQAHAVAPSVVRALWKEYRTSLAAGEIAATDREAQRDKERRDAQAARAEHRRELATIQAKATVEAAKEAARIAARAKSLEPRSAA